MSKEFFSLKTAYLRGIKKQDFTEGLFSWANDQEVTHYMVTGLKPSIKEKMEQLYQDTINNDKEIVFAIVDKKSNKTIGLTGLYQINPQVRSAEFRIIIGEKKSWGKGIGTACTKFIVDYAFRNLNLNKVWLGVNEEIYRNNEYYDAIRMSVLKQEWENKK